MNRIFRNSRTHSLLICTGKLDVGLDRIFDEWKIGSDACPRTTTVKHRRVDELVDSDIDEFECSRR
jgi:hypothetical protein